MTATPATTQPPSHDAVPPEWGQSLADGAPGIALWHIERARAGLAGWEPVHRLAVAMTRTPVHAHPDHTTLFRGAPAVAYALHTANHPAYQAALAKLDASIATLIQARLEQAHRRIDDGRPAQAREYDLINGLTGLGVYLLHRHHDHELLQQVLAYLVRLTHPIGGRYDERPGWWATGSPDRRRSPRWDGGHAGFGMAHGITGPLALLSVTMRQGVIVTGHADAIHTICAWLDRWQQGAATHTWWPEVVDRHELRTGTASLTGPPRPSWCYGTPGIARAQQLAATAVGDPARARTATQALLGCLTYDEQLTHLTDAGLCHGWAGLVHTARCAATDASDELAAATQAAAKRMRRHVQEYGVPADDGFLEGAAGTALTATASPAGTSAADPRWDACLLVG